MELWKRVFEDGFAPLISTAGLRALADALQRDDPTLITGRTLLPAGVPATSPLPVYAACPIGFCGWKDEGCETVSEVMDYFGTMCMAVNNLVGEASCRWFLNWVDETPRGEMRRLLLPVVREVLAGREAG